MFKIRNKMEFYMYKSKLDTLANIEENFGTLDVVECTELIQGLDAKINGISCIITKKGVIVDANICVDSPARAMKINRLSDFFVWKYKNVYETTKRIIIKDLIEAQILLSGRYDDIADFEIESDIDVYKYFYTDATEAESKQKDKIISPSNCKYAGSLICSPLRIGGYDKNAMIIDNKHVKMHGEVLTPPHIVSDMLDLIPTDKGVDKGTFPIDTTFLEPSCGTGNILVQILERKLRLCKTKEDIFNAVASIYGVDIQKDNVLESRLRMLEIVEEKLEILKDTVNIEVFLEIIADVLEKNIVGGDFLKDKWGCMLDERWVSGYVSNALGLIEEDDISRTHGRIVFYTWKWHSITNIERHAEFLHEDH